MFSKGPRPGFGVHRRRAVSDINGFTDTQVGLMFFGGQDSNVEVTINFRVGHVFVLLLRVVTEARVGFSESSVTQMFVKPSPDGASRLPYVQCALPLPFTFQTCDLIDGHACGAATPQSILTSVTPFVPGGAGRWVQGGCDKLPFQCVVIHPTYFDWGLGCSDNSIHSLGEDLINVGKFQVKLI